MITTFRVQNYKALRDVTLNLTPMHLLIGPNDSGKTSLLESLAALSRSLNHELAQAFTGRWEGTELVHKRQQNTPVSLAVSGTNGDEFRYEISTLFLPEGRSANIDSECVKWGAKLWKLRSNIRPGNASVIRRITRGDVDCSKWMEPELMPELASDLSSMVSGVQLFRWNARLLSLPCALDRTAGFRMQSSGFGLARALDALLGGYRDRFDAIERRFKSLFPSITALRILPALAFRSQPSEDELIPILSREDGKGIFVRFHGQDADVPAAHLSEGVLLVLAYLAILYSPEPPRLLLVEEPENGIHPERLEQVITILRELIREQGRTQVVLSSHSPYIVSLFDPEEVTLCRKNDQGAVQVKRLSESAIVRDQLRVFSLGEIWPAEEERIFKESNGVAAAPAEAAP